jgi:hypothetical protein
MSPGLEWIEPDWPLPARVRALSTLRTGGCSHGHYASLNLAAHVGDDPSCVSENRRRLREAAGLPGEPLWLEQVHGTAVAVHDGGADVPRADASIATAEGRVCAVLTADCLPVVLADRAGSRIGVAHAGWRGLVGGVMEATIAALRCPAGELLAWLGPAIGPAAFEVGPEVREAFTKRLPSLAECFVANARGRLQADLYGLARRQLAAAGVTAVYGGGWCTASDPRRFYSFRRDGTTGRMATLAWLE